MYKKELQNLLNLTTFPNFFLLFGNDSYQIEVFTKEVLAKFSDENLLSLYFDEYDFSVAKSHLSESSLFANTNLLHVKSDKKIPAKELKILIELCKKSKDNIFIFELHEGDTKLLFDTQKAFEQNFARFFAPSTPGEAVNLLSYHASKLGLSISDEALYQIYSLQNESLYLASSELNKIANLTKNVDNSMISKLVFSLNGVSFETFFNKIISVQNIKDDFFSYSNDSNFSEIMLVNSLYKAFLRLFKIQTYVKIYGKFDIKEAIGYTPPPNIANTLKNQALSMPIELYKDIFIKLNLIEYDLKTKKDLEKESFLLSCLLSIQNLISKNRKA
ncbi:DNA polymerase III, delta subunit [Campylobacter iguaniorum]|uniref:DNA polymerase III subunit delta n=1 Tax=Campylobacter iguaniorum TaxID=1244531 RepID=UPI00073A2FCA|nr:DNA polymerase III subunit delta [Campylobacter iguaniorum]ALV24837.1 DNA polymerase III, delta subunit [Campylobacter iguaniorum]